MKCGHEEKQATRATNETQAIGHRNLKASKKRGGGISQLKCRELDERPLTSARITDSPDAATALRRPQGSQPAGHGCPEMQPSVNQENTHVPQPQIRWRLITVIT